MIAISLGFLHTFPFTFSSLFISPVLFSALSYPSLPLAFCQMFSCFSLTVLSLKLISNCSLFLVRSPSISHPSNSKQQTPTGRALCDSQLPHVNTCLIQPFVSPIQEQDNDVVVDWLSSLVWELWLAQLTKSFFTHLDIKDWEVGEYGLWLFFVSPGAIMPQVILKNSSGLWLRFWSCFSLPTQSLWLIKEKYTHTFLGGNSPYMTHLLLRKKPLSLFAIF